MKVGITLPQSEITGDPIAVRDFVQAVEESGFDHVVMADHVLGADHAQHPALAGAPYGHENAFHEPFVLMGYLSAYTTTLELVPSVLILSQRQTALVAKQAAQVDLVSGGRFRLGVGIGWNPVEFEALNENFRDRGRRSEEQIALLRALWTQPVVNFEGRWHRVSHAGLNPMPLQRPIPIWMGGGRGAAPGNRAETVIRRVAHLADGWMPQFVSGEEGLATWERLRDYAKEAGRDPADIGLEGRIRAVESSPEDWLREYNWWQEAGASHVNVDTRRGGFQSLDDHLAQLQRFKAA
ncbi:MAG: LLM class F420-dependent oxidoreductase, partial [Candidatus Tectomicrobia bacterium]|nr:LLM class F420-dependent oxidoreductase [Candidatus Tectomicrobia bacterium]